jgi:broad specificity phosphatase PhoE
MGNGGLAGVIAVWNELGPAKPGCAILVRHGATAWNTEKRLQGQTDVPLSPLGIQQAQEVADIITKLAVKPTVLYTSPLSRARITAEILGRALQLPVNPCQELIERAFGAMEGLTGTELEHLYPNRRNNEAGIPGLEPFESLKTRATEAVAGLLAQHQGELIVLVSHGAFINAFLASVSRGQVGSGVTNLVNGGLSVVWSVQGEWELGAINIATHLSQTIGQTQAPTLKLSGHHEQ